MSELFTDLEKKVCQPNLKELFMVKILCALRFVQEDPSSVGAIGIFWTSDQHSCVSNSKTLGEFLKVKANSINTDFRQHGFNDAERLTPDELRAIAAPLGDVTLQDAQNWRRRSHKDAAFNSSTTEDAAIELNSRWWVACMCEVAARRRDGPAAAALPQQHSFVFGDGRPLPVDVAAALALAQRHWSAVFGDERSVPVDAAAVALFPDDAAAGPARVAQLRTNFTHIVAGDMDARSVMERVLTVDVFTAFFLRFGSPSGVRAALEDFTPHTATQVSPTFYCGVCIGADRRGLMQCWNDATEGSWALVEGATPHTFTLLTRSRFRGDGQDCEHTLWVDPTAETARFGFKDDSGRTGTAANLAGIREAFGLTSYSGIRLSEWDIVKQEQARMESDDFMSIAFGDEDGDRDLQGSLLF
jgi:hypothetical protein